VEVRLTSLARVTGNVSTADSVESVSKIVTYHMADAVGASIAALALREGERARVIGLRGLSVICHGNSSRVAMANAIRLGARGVEHRVVERLATRLHERAAVPT